MARTRWTSIPTAKPAVRSSAAQLTVRVRVIMGALLAAAICGPLALLLSLGSSAPAPSGAGGPDWQYQAAAQTVAADFVAGRPTTLPVAEGVDATFGRGNSVGGGLPDAAEPQLSGWRTSTFGSQQWTTFAFRTVTEGRSYLVTVPLLITAEGPVLGASPSLFPAAPATGVYPAIEFAGTREVALPDRADAQVDQWAVAYAAGDSAALRELVGDADPSSRYEGLGGFTADRVDVVRAFVTDELAAADPDAVLLRVRVLLAADSAEQYQTSAEFDLLVTAATSALPRVSAWGPPGSGPTLTAGSNNLAPAPSGP